MKMTKSTNIIVMIIGSLSILSGIFLAIKSDEFNEAFYGIFLGITLIGTACFYNRNKLPNQEE